MRLVVTNLISYLEVPIIMAYTVTQLKAYEDGRLQPMSDYEKISIGYAIKSGEIDENNLPKWLLNAWYHDKVWREIVNDPERKALIKNPENVQDTESQENQPINESTNQTMNEAQNQSENSDHKSDDSKDPKKERDGQQKRPEKPSQASPEALKIPQGITDNKADNSTPTTDTPKARRMRVVNQPKPLPVQSQDQASQTPQETTIDIPKQPAEAAAIDLTGNVVAPFVTQPQPNQKVTVNPAAAFLATSPEDTPQEGMVSIRDANPANRHINPEPTAAGIPVAGQQPQPAQPQEAQPMVFPPQGYTSMSAYDKEVYINNLITNHGYVSLPQYSGWGETTEQQLRNLDGYYKILDVDYYPTQIIGMVVLINNTGFLRKIEEKGGPDKDEVYLTERPLPENSNMRSKFDKCFAVASKKPGKELLVYWNSFPVKYLQDANGAYFWYWPNQIEEVDVKKGSRKPQTSGKKDRLQVPINQVVNAQQNQQ